MVEMGHQAIVGVLRKLVVLCRAFGVDLQRTSREQVFKNQVPEILSPQLDTDHCR
jgi:hypothetical protein